MIVCLVGWFLSFIRKFLLVMVSDFLLFLFSC